MILLSLFFAFLKIGLFTFGGAYGAIPLIREEVLAHAWLTEEEFSYFLGVSESTPGPIMVNMATYVGFAAGGVPGSVIATLGLITPSIILILLIARVLERFRQNRYVDAAFYALRPCSIGLIGAAGLLVVKIAMFHTDLYAETQNFTDLLNFKALLLAAVLMIATRYVKPLKKLHPAVFIAFSAAAGIFLQF